MTHTVLFVDDEPSVLAALRRTLRGVGHRVLTAETPQEALELLGRERVDLLVSDIDMPVMNGIDLIAQVRRQHPSVVRVLLTGRGSMETALRAINDGEVFRYLTKPWSSDELRTIIAAGLARLDGMRQVAAADELAQRRRRLLARLEADHPGITEVPSGTYVLAAQLPRIPFLSALAD
jgi:two-component system, probable response regulator PhcQ